MHGSYSFNLSIAAGVGTGNINKALDSKYRMEIVCKVSLSYQIYSRKIGQSEYCGL